MNLIISTFRELRWFEHYDSRYSPNTTVFRLSSIQSFLLPRDIARTSASFAAQAHNVGIACIPPKVTYIGNYFVSQIYVQPKALVVLPNDPPIGDAAAIAGVWNYIFVPANSIEAYKAASIWSSSAEKIYPIGGDDYLNVIGDYFDEYIAWCLHHP